MFQIRRIYDEVLPVNKEALRQVREIFWEQFKEAPKSDAKYEMPIKPQDTCMPYFVYDALTQKEPLRRAFARKVVKAILERKYPELCPAGYIKNIVRSFKDDPVRLREFKYVKPQKVQQRVLRKFRHKIALVVNDRHSFHHVHERGYVESPVRVKSILSKIVSSEMFDRIPPANFPDKHIREVHDSDFLAYLRRICEEMSGNKSLYPYVFPIRNRMRPPKDRSVLAGYYCIDTFTPLNHTAYLAARRGVDCALSAARQIIRGRTLAYALVRPPGHHAERRSFGGFCYFNNAAIAAQYLRTYGNIAILDVDYHHGNGQQDIFYDCPGMNMQGGRL